LGAWAYWKGSAPPEVPVAAVTRQTIESTVTTNGKVEPVEWAAARAEREGAVIAIPVKEDQRVAKGAILAQLDNRAAQTELASANARIEEARAAIAALEAGGRAADFATIDSEIRQAQYDRDEAQREIATLERLIAKNAAPRSELIEWKAKLERATLRIRAAEERRKSLIDRSSLDAARARMKDAEAQADLIRRKLDLGVIRAPLDGVVYSLEAKPGAWLNPGALVANVGRIDRLRVLVYVDEPELGRVNASMPVRITWDGLPGREWRGAVDRVPTEIEALNTRQVGKVTCLIENPGGELRPGANVNAFIESKVVKDALSLPKEAIRRQGAEVGVLLLEGAVLRFRKVTAGTASITRIEILSGLKDGDKVALPTETPLEDGMKVTPILR
jgi:HlyD family secretion protein